ncbi:hypothetical protein GUJ93_ZPchr0013g36049 [Zizania palustris]|uniref:Uncharacterized protein n=1 Tax=Zizania palustris TaxID=103762 RepID=A0A8J5X9K0_ZIZPA|nr:hypothetical protein GUJ93_ZPchr0013g36049 [Zizania palustris]
MHKVESEVRDVVKASKKSLLFYNRMKDSSVLKEVREGLWVSRIAMGAALANVPVMLTDHSLGRNKLEQLMKLGSMSKLEEIDSTYNIMKHTKDRGSNRSDGTKDLPLWDWSQEIDEQSGLYDRFDVTLEKVL